MVVVIVTQVGEAQLGRRRNRGQIDPSIIGGGAATQFQVPGDDTDIDLADTRFALFG